MMTMNEKEKRIEEFHRAAKSIVELFQAGEVLTGHQETYSSIRSMICRLDTVAYAAAT
jgi:hypothetical protein